MKIDVRHTAALAKLRLDEDKIEQFAAQMQDIVSMVEQLPEIDSELTLADRSNPMLLRADEIGPSLTRDELLGNAPQKQAGCIVVPKTV